MMFNRRGEMTTQQIVVLVILIASFAVLLFFIVGMQFGEETEKELCHNSVATRSSSVIPVDSVPLDCQRSYVCITMDDTCEAMTKPIKKKVKTKEEVYEVLANELADCWWMFGEGKVNYVGKDFFSNLYCSLCSQIAFDDSVKKIFPDGNFEKEEFFHYMSLNTSRVSGSEKTYSEYLYGTNNVQDLFNVSFGQVDIDSQYYALMGITSDVSTVGWVAVGAAVGVGAIIFLPVSVGMMGAVAIGGTAGGLAGGEIVAPVVRGLNKKVYVAPSLVEVNSESFDKLECDEITTKS